MQAILDALLAQLVAALVPTLMAILAAKLTGLWDWLKERWNVDIEAKHRAALNEAIMTAVENAIRRGIPEAEIGRVAKDYVRRSVPDALRRLGATEDVLSDKIEALRSKVKVIL